MMRLIIACIVALLVYAWSALTCLEAAPLTLIYDPTRSPLIACSPLRACAIQLCGNETVEDTVAGDTDHWQIVRGVSDGTIPTYYLKPSALYLPQTNLIITTNRRIYELTLVSVRHTAHTIYTVTCP